jgi:hypothetical protein
MPAASEDATKFRMDLNPHPRGNWILIVGALGCLAF